MHRRRSHSRTKTRAFQLLSVSLVASYFLAPALQAQVIRGELVEDFQEAPIEGAFIVLFDELGREQDAVLTNAEGRFVFRLAAPGRYQLKAERIGYESFTSPMLDLSANQVLDYQMKMPVLPVQLAAINVEGQRQCRTRPAEGERTARVWEEARKALTAAVWTEEQRSFRFTTRLYERILDPGNLMILQEDPAEVRMGFSVNPFQSLSAEELAEGGYVRRVTENGSSDATDFYAPDANVLLSDVFLEGHCFDIVQGSGENGGLIGLTFEPVEREDRPEDVSDIRGVLWLSERDANLRFVEYQYDNLPFDVQSNRLGGRLEFRLLPGGAWIVDDWWIRMPVINTLAEPNRSQMIAIKEEGGEVIGISEPSGRRLGRFRRATLTGQVYDSTRNAPLGGATVSLLGTNHATTTGPGGRYTMEDLPIGDYFITFSHPRVSLFRLGSVLRPVQLRAQQTTNAHLAVPPVQRLVPSLCAEDMPDENAAVVVGIVTDAGGGEPVSGANVRVTWMEWRARQQVDGDADVQGVERGFQTTSDDGGNFVVCGVPARVPLSAQAVIELEEGDIVGETVSFELLPLSVMESHLRIDASATPDASAADDSSEAPAGDER